MLSLHGSILSNTNRRRLERAIRNQANRLVGDLRGLNITRLKGVALRVSNFIFDQIENLQNNTIQLADRALRSSTPGVEINNALLEFKAGLGESLSNFRWRTESALKRFIRDTLESVNIRGAPGTALRELWGSASVQEVLESAGPLVEDRVNRIISIITRAIRA